ncbi:MAG: hypothetical protein QCI38_07365 [Candidatus Thermoplasmatota archaeon]|nr:hypothetical protein [Candidatus Thermoplasmatota archaeon]
MIKAKSGHIRLKKGKYSDLVPVFPEIFTSFLNSTNQNDEESQEVNNMLLQLNLRDLEKNLKPEGFNRQNAVRLIFPVAKKPEFYFYSFTRSMEVVKSTETTSQLLEAAGIGHDVVWDDMFIDELKRRKLAAK